MAEYNGALSPKAGLRGRRPSTYTSTQMWLCSAVRDGLGFALSKVDAAGVTPRWGSSRHLTGSVYAAYKATQMAANAIPTPELKVARKKKKRRMRAAQPSRRNSGSKSYCAREYLG